MMTDNLGIWANTYETIHSHSSDGSPGGESCAVISSNPSWTSKICIINKNECWNSHLFWCAISGCCLHRSHRMSNVVIASETTTITTDKHWMEKFCTKIFPQKKEIPLKKVHNILIFSLYCIRTTEGVTSTEHDDDETMKLTKYLIYTMYVHIYEHENVCALLCDANKHPENCFCILCMLLWKLII